MTVTVAAEKTIAIADTPTVETYRDDDRAAVTEFLQRYPQCHPVQLPAWRRAVIRTYGGRDVSLIARRSRPDGSREILGFLPLWADDAGRCALSAPHASAAGPLFGKDCDPEAVYRRFLQAVRGRCREGTQRRCVVRDVADENVPADSRLDRERSVYRLDLPSTDEEAFAAARSTARTRLRKSKKKGVTVNFGSGQVDAFYGLYVRAMHSKGTPCHPRRLLDALIEEFGDDADVLIASDPQGRPAAGMFVLRTSGGMHYPWQASEPSCLPLCPNDALIWAAIRMELQRGGRWIDMGRSARQSPQAHFKVKWGGCEQRLITTEIGNRTKGSTRHAPSAVLTRVWSRFPIPLTRVLGPAVRRFLP